MNRQNIKGVKTPNFKGIDQQNMARRNRIKEIQRTQKLPNNKFGRIVAGIQERQLKKANTSKKIQQSSLIKGYYNKRQTPTV